MEIKWADGWLEQFAEDEFAEICETRPGRSIIYKRAFSPRIADFFLTVRDREALLDYGSDFRVANKASVREWDIGVLRLTFRDPSRTVLTKMEWSDEDHPGFYRLYNYCTWSAETLEVKAFRPRDSKDRCLRALGEAVLRPGQLRFRNRLREAYGGRCAITNVDIWEVLEAAHIMPYRGTEYDHVQNGILLRCDLHRLFDRLLVSVDPLTMQVVLAPTLRKHPMYMHSNSIKLRLPKHALHSPAIVALRDHWKRFREVHYTAQTKIGMNASGRIIKS
jgi:HNH endonuclease